MSDIIQGPFGHTPYVRPVQDNPLAGVTTKALLDELKRRGEPAPKPENIRPCDTCVQFVAYTGPRDEPPKGWTCCGMGHAPDFKMPVTNDPGEEYGFFRRNCRNYSKR